MSLPWVLIGIVSVKGVGDVFGTFSFQHPPQSGDKDSDSSLSLSLSPHYLNFLMGKKVKESVTEFENKSNEF